MGSLVRGKKPAPEGDNASLKIEPQDDNDTRESVVNAGIAHKDDDVARAALLINLGQSSWTSKSRSRTVAAGSSRT
jgi:hypothetical protein